MVCLMPAATVRTELPFLDLGDDTRVSGNGKFFGNGSIELETPSFLPFRRDWIIVGDLFENLGWMIYYYTCVLDFKSGDHIISCPCFTGIQN